MSTNRDLLREAIADAKSVKDTAIANAKAALEEAFTPYLKEKLSAKLSEMEEGDEDLEVMDEMTNEADELTDEEISLDELLDELDSDENLDEAKKKEKDEEKKDKPKKDDSKKAPKESKEDEEVSIEDMSEEDLKSFIEDVIKDMVSAGELEADGETEGAEDELAMGDEIAAEPAIDVTDEAGEELNLDELLAELETEEDEEVSLDELLAELESEASEEVELDEEKGEIQGELDEAYKTIETLKSDLNEINLLNAKLLYTNKIFRNRSLTESQKVKVLTSFDKAKTKNEVKLVYETLQEGLKTSTTKAPIKESLNFASKIMGNPTKRPIIENDAFARMRELAGLKK